MNRQSYILHKKTLQEWSTLFVLNGRILAERFERMIHRVPMMWRERVLLVVLVSQLVVILFLSLTHNPYFSYDEANTVLIAQKSVRDIISILSYEQNFPAYYFIIHGLFLVSGGSILAVMLFQYAIWLCSIVVFYWLMRILRASRTVRLFFTVLYSFTVSVTTYASNVRMYGAMALLTIVIIYLLIRYAKEKKMSDAFFVAGATGVLVLLHPIAVVTLGVLSVLGIFVIKEKKTRIFYYAFLFLALLVVIGNLALKQRSLTAIYHTEGVRYFNELPAHLHQIPDRLLFTIKGSWLLFLVISYLITRFFRAGGNYQQDWFIVAGFGIVLIGLSITADRLIAFHHISYLSPILLLLIYKGLQTLRDAQRFAFSGFLFIYFATISVSSSVLQAANQQQFSLYCQAVSQLEPGVIITNYIMAPFSSHCLDVPRLAVYVLEHDGSLTKYTDLTSAETLKMLARMGGLYSNTKERIAYRAFLSKYIDHARASVAMIHARELGERLYYLTMGEQALYSEELVLFQDDYRYAGEPLPRVFLFEKITRE